MNEVTTIGLDLAKNVFQVHGVDGGGSTVFRRQLRRSQVLRFFERQPACLVGIEACATSHHWARETGSSRGGASIWSPGTGVSAGPIAATTTPASRATNAGARIPMEPGVGAAPVAAITVRPGQPS